jgi:hypothetical protein
VVRDTEQGEHERRLMRSAGVASEALVIGKSIMGPLCPREDHRQGRGKPRLRRWKVYFDAAPSAEAACRRVDAPGVASLGYEQRCRAALTGMRASDSHDEGASPGAHATDTVGARSRNDSPRSGPQRPDAGCRQPRVAVHHTTGSCRPGSAGSHQVGGKSPCL